MILNQTFLAVVQKFQASVDDYDYSSHPVLHPRHSHRPRVDVLRSPSDQGIREGCCARNHAGTGY